MSSTAPPDPAIKEIIDFWFSLTPKDWFGTSNDELITSRFGHLVETARLTDDLDASWLNSPSGSLAMILLLDQFTRNIFRAGNHPEPGLSWSGDAKALRIAIQSVARGYDKQIQKDYAAGPMAGVPHRHFFYLPFMHAEDMTSQIASCALFSLVKAESDVAVLKRQIEGREETDAEKATRELVEMSVTFAAKHRDCVAAVGRFPKRNEPLGRESSEKEKEWLEKYPEGF